MRKPEIQIYDFSVFDGRNIYSHHPVVKMRVNIGKYGFIPTNEIPGFNESLLRMLPGLKTNCCGLGYEGGFLERLREGTYMAHVLEHVILEMQYMLGYHVKFGKTRTEQEPSLYYIVYEFENEVCGIECGKAAVFILNRLLSGKSVDMGAFLTDLKRASVNSDLGPSTLAIVNEAKERGIPVTRIGTDSLVRLGCGRHSRMIESTLTDRTSCISADISCNKQLTKSLLGEHQIPVPYGKVVYSEISAWMAAEQIGMPVVLKPFNGNQGKGVHLNLNSERELKAAFQDASGFSSEIIVEKYIKGRDYRVLVVGNKVRAVSERRPASVTGDGTHSILELIEMVNQDPNRGEQHEKPLTKMRLDGVALNLLKKNGLKAESIPYPGQVVHLRENGNLSTGGTAIDCTDKIHPDNAELAVRAAHAIGIDIAGIDVVTENIEQSILETGGAIVEVNAAPGIRMHLYPSEGKPRNVAKDIVDYLFPNEKSMRFPIVSVTGTNGKTTVVRLIQHTLTLTGKCVGMTSTSGTFIGKKCIFKGDNSGPKSAKALLSNPTIDAAVLETARGGILREGLGYDLADVGVITNITEDHLGRDQSYTLEDLAFIKSLVAEAVKKDGAAVLNAEDPSTPMILKRIKAKPVLFCKDAKALEPHWCSDYVYVFVRDGTICVKDGARQHDVLRIGEIPITWGGRIACNVENALAAVGALYALDIPLETIREGLQSFTDNSGRFQLYELSGISIMLDYGHNPAGYDEVIKACGKLEYGRLVGVIGMPGDRPDSLIREVGERCARAFDCLYIKEDMELRGRSRGEVPRLLYDAAINCGFPREHAVIIERECDALRMAVREAKENDLIVVFYEALDGVQAVMKELGAQKCSPLKRPRKFALTGSI